MRPNHFDMLPKQINSEQVYYGCLRFIGGLLVYWLMVGVGSHSLDACLMQESKEIDAVCRADFAMPESAAVYLEFSDPAATIDLILQHRLTQALLELETVKQGLAAPQMAMAKIVVGTLEEQLQQSWPQIIGSITKHGASIAFDRDSNGVVFVSRAASGESLREIVKAILGWVNLEARMNKRDKPYEAEDYRGHRILKFQNAAIARVDDWFLAGNQVQLIRKTMDRLIEGPENAQKSLAAQPAFRRARQLQPTSDTAWVYLDLKAIRRAGLAQELFAKRTNQPILELLFGGIRDSLPTADYLTANLSLCNDEIGFEMSLPKTSDSKEIGHTFFYATEPISKQSFVIESEQVIGRIVGRRDLAAWWLAKEDLYDENVIAQLALVDSQFTTVLSGMNFGEDFLAAFEPCLQIIVADQSNENSAAAVKLPSFAFVGRLKDPTEMKRRLRIAFNSVIGFANIQGGMEGMPPLDFMTEFQDGVEITAATYVLDARAAKSQVPLDLSPSLAFAADFIIISSTKELALELGQKCLHQTHELDANRNLMTEISLPMLTAALGKNREQLVVQNMLEEGNKRSQAEQNIDQLLTLLQQFDRFTSQLDMQPDAFKLTTRLQFKSSQTSSEK